MTETFVVSTASEIRRFVAWLGARSFKYALQITVKRVDREAGVDQEAVLRGMERRIADFTGHEPDEVHDEMLARHYGTVEVDLGGGKKLVRPARRTRTGENSLGRAEMQQHMRFVEAFAARELGLQVGRR